MLKYGQSFTDVIVGCVVCTFDFLTEDFLSFLVRLVTKMKLVSPRNIH